MLLANLGRVLMLMLMLGGLASRAAAQDPAMTNREDAVFDPPAAVEPNEAPSARAEVFRSMGFRRITDLGVSIAPPPGRLPDPITTPPTSQEPGAAIAGLEYRYSLQPFYWESSALCCRLASTTRGSPRRQRCWSSILLGRRSMSWAMAGPRMNWSTIRFRSRWNGPARALRLNSSKP